uniref:22 kDa protein n=1 Tax=Holcus ophiovirus TaxID=2983946 RepID=A0A9N6YK10_9VIRU|nr:TPA_asm: 22 kDa protein [Holcus ophiovirus]
MEAQLESRLNLSLRLIKSDNNSLDERNKKVLRCLNEYKTSYPTIFRFFVGSWLLDKKEMSSPFNKKAIIIIQSVNDLIDVDSYKNIEIVLAKGFDLVLSSFFFRLEKEEMMIYYEDNLYEIHHNFKIPKYSAMLDKDDEKTKSNNITNFNNAKNNKGKGRMI